MEDDNLAHLPPPLPHKPRHVFGDAIFVAAHHTLTRLPQTERTCSVCAVVKVTVHEQGGGARREWRFSQHGEQTTSELVCTGLIGQAAP